MTPPVPTPPAGGAGVTGAPAASRRSRLARVARERNPLPPGAIAVAVGLATQGLTAYAYLIIASHALPADRYSTLAALWALTFVAAPGLFLPLEQEVGRALASRRVRGLGGRPVLVRAGTLGAGLVVALLAISVAVSAPLVNRLFDGQGLLLVGFCIAIACYSAYYLARGALAGSGRFAAYSAVIVVESFVRIGVSLVLAVVGTKSAGAFSLAIGLPCLLAVLLVLPSQRAIARHGPQAAWGELGTALGLLLVGSLLAQLLVNIGPLAVKALSTDDPGAAGRFLDGLIVSRVPLFFFQAVQASLLPRLAAQAAARRIDEFRGTLRTILILVVAVTAAATLTMAAIGPLVVRILFGSAVDLGHGDLALLAFGSGLAMAALALAQGCIALGSYGRAALGWAAGIAAVAVALAVLPGVILRAELAFCAGIVVATVALAAGLRSRLAAG